MRWLFLLLVVLNVSFYAFQLQLSPLQVTQVPPLVPYSASGSRIELLSESALGPREQKRTGVMENESCLFLGGFDEEGAARALEQRLLSLDIQATVQTAETAAGIDYWVYLPPLASRQASLRQLRELQARNIDAYIITVGDLANGVSLGIFSRKDSAEGVVARLRSIDYTALVRELPRMHRKQWLRVAPDASAALTDAILQRLINEFPTMQHRQMPCESIATFKSFE